MIWYKERIAVLVSEFAAQAPYSYWSSDLFSSIHPKFVPTSIHRTMSNVAIIMGTWKRVQKTAEIWSDRKTLIAVYQGYLVTSMMMCLAYPRETTIAELARNLPCDSPEGKICTFIAEKDSPYRHMRNSIAHGTFELQERSEGLCVHFKDHDWEESRSASQVELDCLLVFDILMSAFETTRPTRQSQRTR
jgi:hypothetical protein